MSHVTLSFTCISKYNNLVVKGVMRFEGTRSAITMVPGIVFSVSGFVIVAYIFPSLQYLIYSFLWENLMLKALKQLWMCFIAVVTQVLTLVSDNPMI